MVDKNAESFGNAVLGENTYDISDYLSAGFDGSDEVIYKTGVLSDNASFVSAGQMDSIVKSQMISIIKFLSTRNSGYTRNDIAANIGCSSGGTFSQALHALIESDFIVKYVPFGYSKRMEHYKLADPFCMFYIKFVENKNKLNETFWQHKHVDQSVISWRGFAFESVCFNHISQIKQALEIGGANATYSAWSKKEDDAEGTQIDLIIERKDNVVNMCEIKFYGNDFSVNKDYYKTLLNRQELLSKELSPKVIIHNTLITTYGLKYNEYSSAFDSVITLDDLFIK